MPLSDGTLALIEKVRRDKYMLPTEATWDATQARVATGLFPDEPEWAARYLAAFRNGLIVPAGRVMAGAGSGRAVTWLNCFVAPLLQDSLLTEPGCAGLGIMDALRSVARSMQLGGGVGTDFSPLRPRGAAVRGVGSIASGVVPFMVMWDAMCRTIMSSGARRGAMMATLDDDHPDLWHPDPAVPTFLNAKRQPGALTQFNVSILVSDRFMAARAAGDEWELGHHEPPAEGGSADGRRARLNRATGEVGTWHVYRTVPARQLWAEIMASNHRFAEPGVIFVDRVNQMNNLYYCEDVRCANPCVTGDTLVVVAGRGPVPIAQLAEEGVDVPVFSVDEATGGQVVRMGRNPRLTKRNAALVKVTLDDGSVLRVTPDHKFPLRDGRRVEARHLVPSDTAHNDGLNFLIFGDNDRWDSFSADKKSYWGTIRAIEYINERADVYNLTVDEHHNYATVTLTDGNRASGPYVANCGEQMLAPDNNCNLSHVNLANLVEARFTDRARWQLDRLPELARLLVRGLDNVVDLSPYPTEAQHAEGQAKRRLGIGITGLGTALMELELRYGEESLDAVDQVMTHLRDQVYLASTELARERGPFPLFDPERYLAGRFVKTLPAPLRERIRTSGIRNALLLTVAPTGTGTIAAADNASSGVEPAFLARYERKMLQPDGTLAPSVVEDLGFRRYADARFGGDLDAALGALLPRYMVTTEDLVPEDHLVVQATVQFRVDAAVSKTVNVPAATGLTDFAAIYDRAYELGCKGCTTYRPDPTSGRGAVLAPATPATPSQIIIQGPTVVLTEELSTGLSSVDTTVVTIEKEKDSPAPEAGRGGRPDQLAGTTTRLRWPGLAYPLFLTVNDVVEADGRRRPFEIFVNSKAAEDGHWYAVLTRLVSAVMRRGGDLAFLLEELEQVHHARGGAWVGGRYVPSEVALIGHTLRAHFEAIGYLAPGVVAEAAVDGAPLTSSAGAKESANVGKSEGSPAPLGTRACPRCGSFSTVRETGCERCLDCGWSSCG